MRAGRRRASAGFVGGLQDDVAGERPGLKDTVVPVFGELEDVVEDRGDTRFSRVAGRTDTSGRSWGKLRLEPDLGAGGRNASARARG